MLVAAAAAGYAAVARTQPTHPTLAVRDSYLLVSVEAPPAWIERHRPTITWEGREVRLPVAFRYRFTGPRGPDWGAVPEEARQALTIQGVEVPVRTSPPTPCRVSNEPALGLIPEQGGPREVALSVAAWVSVGPLDRPSVSPARASNQTLASGEDVAKSVAQLIAAGQVIDVGSAP
ncbi:hypothetical protein C1280_02935 [Gemmata obscuriglobus]|uniref:Uncharacterized protein n=1 Tax=Gemmata obscuriglobus TaxID=114 RepID=A0A2Z3GYY2_9BACT|nr:hypothetical protein C1280_02935 [Gemmata obscuriglobus]